MTPLEDPFRPELRDDERILWSGKPELSPILSWSDLFFIPFALVFLTMGLYDFTSEIGHRSRLEPFLAVTSAVFILVGLYIFVGRFVLKTLATRRTFYAVTNKGALVLRTFPRKGLVSGYLDEITAMSKDIYRSGRGTISFGNETTWHATIGSGDPFGFLGPFGPLSLAFVNVRDVEKIYALIDSAKRATRG